MRLGCVLVFGLSATMAAAIAPAGEQDQPSAAVQAERDKLADIQSFVGDWRGVGQLKRGSIEGSWIEESTWAWEFKNQRAAIVFNAPKNKFYEQGRISPAEKPGRYILVATRSGGKQQDTFHGSLNDERLVFRAENAEKGQPAAISLRQVARGKRLLILFERRLGDTNRYLRLAEVGYTRKGSGFGKVSGGPECIVTGGAAAIAVQYQGKTYYVCCSGCRDYFVDNPEEVLADYRQRLAERKK